MKALLVIPCSGRKRTGGDINLKWSIQQSALKRLSEKSAELLLELRRKLAEQFGYVGGEDLGGRAPAPIPLMAACTRYDGNLYRRIDELQWKVLRDSDSIEIVIISALYGLVAPWEAIREYDRTMKEKIAPRIQLVRWWLQRGLASLLGEYSEQSEVAIIHDFLGGAYAEISHEFVRLGTGVPIKHYSFPSLGSGADYHRGQKVQSLLVAHLPMEDDLKVV